MGFHEGLVVRQGVETIFTGPVKGLIVLRMFKNELLGWLNEYLKVKEERLGTGKRRSDERHREGAKALGLFR